MLVRWYPFNGLRRWNRYYFNPSHWPTWESNYGVRHFHPRADLVESEEEYKILLELPGLNKDDFDISLSEGLLTVSGEKKVENADEKDHTYRLFERYSGAFHRSFKLPEDVNEKGIEADYNNGVLTVRLPRSPKAKPREIPVKVGK